MANRFWTSNSQRSVEAKGHGPAYSRDGGKVLNDTETKPPYNENIGPDSPDLNKVGFPTVKIATKWHYMFEGLTGARPEGMSGPLLPNGNFYSDEAIGKNWEALGKIGEALGKAGAMADAASNKGNSPSGGVEPSKNSGSAPIETRFSGHVRRRGEG